MSYVQARMLGTLSFEACSDPHAAGLSEVGFRVGDFVLQSGGEVIDVSGRDIHRHTLEQRRAVAAHGIAPYLNQ
jgi:hypothetical protein